ncbi:MAG: leucine-rich repeat domain-containing protein, partial [Lentisphaeria bacterium]|nr:leucine-rich repeat domain-containing protein [Lentisphaeria bacterium]
RDEAREDLASERGKNDNLRSQNAGLRKELDRSIGAETFADCRCLEEINIPASVTTIGSGAFKNCLALKSVILNAEEIPTDCFFNCLSLQSVSLSAAAVIGERAFYNCRSLSALSISSALRTIGDEAFARCRSLQTAELPADNDVFGTNLFRECPRLGKITVTGSVLRQTDTTFPPHITPVHK